jgi:LmbE family N-acetylglucosaminyl deacetylase
MRVLHVSPHPDDEVLGAPATLMALRDAQHDVLNLACSFGSTREAERRAELVAALKVARFQWRETSRPIGISRSDDLEIAQTDLAQEIVTLIEGDAVELVVSPSPHDGHHGHEVVGRATLEAIAGLDEPPVLWMWGLWSDLPFPTLFVPFDDARLAEVIRCLEQHTGEIARSDYRAVVGGRSRALRVLGVERIFGFGEPKADGPYRHLLCDARPNAEVLTEAIRADDDWFLGVPRIPDFHNPLAAAKRSGAIGWWLRGPSLQARQSRGDVLVRRAGS